MWFKKLEIFGHICLLFHFAFVLTCPGGFCLDGPQLLLFFLTSSWPLLESVLYSSSIVIFDFVLTSPWVFAGVGLSFCYSKSPSHRYYKYFTYFVYLLLGLSPSLCFIHPLLFIYDFVLTSPWIFAMVGLSFCYSLYPLLGLYPHLRISPSLQYYYFLHILFTFFLVSPQFCTLCILSCSSLIYF